MTTKQTLDNIANQIENALFEATKSTLHPIIIHRYNAQTGSIYLKLDWGAAWSIRIADHDGYDNLSYRFNVCLTPMPPTVINADNRPRWWYSHADIDQLITEIVTQRSQLIEQYGNAGYQKRIAAAKRNAKSSRFYSHPTTHLVQYSAKKKKRTPIHL